MHERKQLIETAYADRSQLPNAQDAILSVIDDLDKGRLRVAEPAEDGWVVNTWVKQAVLLYFGIAQMETLEAGPFEYHDKIPTKHGLESQGIRVVPPGTARYGSYLEPGAILMPGYVNIGAWVGRGTMVDTWATVGSCAQIGRDVHLAGGVGIGGVLSQQARSLSSLRMARLSAHVALWWKVFVLVRKPSLEPTSCSLRVHRLSMSRGHPKSHQGLRAATCGCDSGCTSTCFPGRHLSPTLCIDYRRAKRVDR